MHLLLRRAWGTLRRARFALAAALVFAATAFEYFEKIRNVISRLWELLHFIRSVWSLYVFLEVFAVMLVTVGVVFGLWWPEVAGPMGTLVQRSKAKGAAKISGSIGLVAAVAFGVLVLLSHYSSNDDVDVLVRTTSLGPMSISVYGNNGHVDYTTYRETDKGGPEGYAKITFQNWGSTADYNCGWILFLIRGTDLTRFTELRFLVRGEAGDEQIGVKAKDAHGTEVALRLDHHYLWERRITTAWQQAIIPLVNFGNVDRNLMDNVSLFANGTMVETRPQTIYIGGIEFR
jgi:hypothetical protein